jgi:hypothetical protein
LPDKHALVVGGLVDKVGAVSEEARFCQAGVAIGNGGSESGSAEDKILNLRQGDS